MNPLAVFVAVVFILLPALLFVIAMDSNITAIFFQLDGQAYTNVANSVSYALTVIIILVLGAIAVMIIYRKYT